MRTGKTSKSPAKLGDVAIEAVKLILQRQDRLENAECFLTRTHGLSPANTASTTAQVRAIFSRID
ncbi:hypothetical protein C8J25_10933 [Sphingomonas faeni]|uniref:Uncharacterized protein n=1 Tax=Sphingomonas faeni TaxID=185950 RepID=A0A2T5TZB7_9SPHN|nr:hypothetical protein C8J25_10933 [Sphingomonas faeni]